MSTSSGSIELSRIKSILGTLALDSGTTLNVASVVDSTSTVTGSTVLAGGLGVAKSIYSNSLSAASVSTASLNTTSTTDSSSTSTGSVTLLGGLGVAKSIYSNSLSAASVRVTGTTDSSSPSTGSVVISGGLAISSTTDASDYNIGGSFTTAGGVGIAKTLFVNGDTYANGILSVGGRLTCQDSSNVSSTGNGVVANTFGSEFNNVGILNSGSIYFQNSTQGPPTFTNRSTGTKIVFVANTSGSSVDYAIGADTNSIWYSASTVSSLHKFYCGTTNVVSIGNSLLSVNASAALSVANTTDSTSTSTGSATLAGGLGVAKNVTIGGTLSIPVTVSTPTTSNLVNVTSVTSAKFTSTRNGTAVTGYGQVVLVPVVVSGTSTLDISVPGRSTNFTSFADLTVFGVTGIDGSGNALVGVSVYAISGTTTARIKFTANDTSSHLIQFGLYF